MKASKELLNHLSANVWGVTSEGFRTILEAYNGEVEENEEQPITEQPSIHVQLPTDSEQSHIIETLQDCVNDLDARIKQLEAMQAPTLKRNL